MLTDKELEEIRINTEVRMNINSVGNNDLSVSIQKMNELLKSATDAQINEENKMMKADVVESVTGLGDMIDVRA